MCRQAQYQLVLSEILMFSLVALPLAAHIHSKWFISPSLSIFIYSNAMQEEKGGGVECALIRNSNSTIVLL